MADGNLNEYDYRLAIEQAEWRGGVTNELKNINETQESIKKTQDEGFTAINSRLDNLEEVINKRIDEVEKEANRKIEINKTDIGNLQKKTIKIAASVAIILPILLLVLKSLLKI